MFAMKTIILTAIFSLTITAPLLADDTNVLGDDKSRVSYAIGMMLGTRWKQEGIDVSNEVVLRALNDIQAGRTTLLTEQQMGETLSQFQRGLAAKAEQRRQEMGQKNRQAGEAFLAQNKAKAGGRYAAGRPAIQSHHRRNRALAHGRRHGDGEL